jgi:CRISPR-associated endonuclease Cas1
VTLFGYGIQVHVDRGHLVMKDGIGADRRHVRLPRIGHGLKRLVIIGSDGMVSLAALRWLLDQDAALVLLERDGKVLAVIGPVQPSDARLRRAQALAHQSGAALLIARELISRKLAGQEQLIRHDMKDAATADAISRFRKRLPLADNLDTIRLLESQAALAYWSAWRTLPIAFPRQDMRRVPAHWGTFGSRKSPLTGSSRLAVNPPGAILNYCYALLESETRLAASALGLDPGIGMLHADAPRRDSLACDIMEAVRPSVDAWLFDWITKELFRRSDFFEKPNGNCRLMGSFAAKLSLTAPTWRRAVAPVAEWVARTIWSSAARAKSQRGIATPLTQRHRSEARGGDYTPTTQRAPEPERICRTCGALLKEGKTHCASCSVPISRAILIEAAKLGRIATHSPEAEAQRAATQRRQVTARKAWRAYDQPDWLTKDFYAERIQPRLSSLRISAIASALLVSRPYAAEIRAGRRRPHPRHWEALANLVGMLPGASNHPNTP